MTGSMLHLSGERRAAMQEAYDARFDELFAEIEAAERAEYDQHFDHAFQVLHPFTPNPARTRQQVLARLADEQDDQF